MTVSQLIENLQKYQEEYGDNEVLIDDIKGYKSCKRFGLFHRDMCDEDDTQYCLISF
jgi:hypothetical protein